jgi:hypothetical protein
MVHIPDRTLSANSCLSQGERKQMPENHYAISPEGKRLLLGLLLTHKDYLETEGEANDESELDLTDSLIELFEEN